MAPDNVVLHYSRASRSITALWMLEELGVPYRLVDRDVGAHKNRASDYLDPNPMGRAPTLQIGRVVVSESPAIGIYLADRYGYGSLAPCIEHPDRGPYLKWMVFSTAVFEPATSLMGARVGFGAAGPPTRSLAWDDAGEVVDMLAEALDGRDYILGPRFSAADVMLGSSLAVRLFMGMLPAEPSLAAYAERLQARRAWKRAADVNWPEAVDA